MSGSNGPQLAIVLELIGPKAKLALGASAKTQILPLRQLVALGAVPPGGPSAALWLKQLGLTPPRRRDCGAAWLLLHESDQPIPLLEWVELVSGDCSAKAAASCWLWLLGQQQLFRYKALRVEARSLDDLRHLRHDRRRLVLQQQALCTWHQALAERKPLNEAVLTSGALADLAVLQQWASGGTRLELLPTPLSAPLKQGLHAAHCSLESGAIRHLLVDLGQWNPHQLPSLHGSHWELGFSPDLLEEAGRLLEAASQPQPGDDRRLDLTGQRSFTIDDDDTREIDDGLALEITAEGEKRIWIHIADPGRLVAAGSALDQEARRRGSSLYLAQGNLPMFPLELSTGPFSLLCGQRSAAWSLAVELAEDGSISTFALYRSWVKPTYRLSYEDADELIDLAPPQEQDLLLLHQLLLRRRQWRLSEGALLLEQLEGRIREQDGTPELEITEPGAARILVAEAMILAGAAVAEWGRSQGLALPYRSQLPAALPPEQELAQLPPGPVRHAAIKRCLSRGLTGTEAAPHFSLGLAAYVQATSPIRRYGDLLVQRQLAAHLDGTPPIDAQMMLALLNELEGPIREGLAISREDHRHWQQVWFAAHKTQQWQAIFLRWLRPQDNLGLVHVEALGMDLAALCPRGCDPADALSLQVEQVDPLRDQLRLGARR